MESEYHLQEEFGRAQGQEADDSNASGKHAMESEEHLQGEFRRAQGQQADNSKRVRTSGRKNRAWFKYCKSLPTHLKQQQNDVRGDEMCGPGEGNGKEQAETGMLHGERHEATSLRASDPSRGKQGRRAGLSEEERCTVWMPAKKRLCSQRRSGPLSPFCLIHLQNSTLPLEQNAPASDPASASSAATGSSACAPLAMMSSCPHCSAAMATSKLEKHFGRCNVLRKQAQLESSHFYLCDANSGGEGGGGDCETKTTYTAEDDGGGSAVNVGLVGLVGLAERAFASKVKECFDKHVPALKENVLQAQGCQALFEASLAGGSESHPHPHFNSSPRLLFTPSPSWALLYMHQTYVEKTRARVQERERESERKRERGRDINTCICICI